MTDSESNLLSSCSSSRNRECNRYFFRCFGIAAVFLLLSLPYSQTAHAQNSWTDRVTFRGYLKFMQTNLIQDADSILTENLIHNRLNFRLLISDRMTGGIEVRNRVFYGDLVKSIPGYGDLVSGYDGVFHLEKTWVDSDAVVINTIVDRLWMNYSADAYELRIGRQRINWGYNPVWNPNDLFNAFDYLDFDYEERPGADAVSGEVYIGDMSSISGAFKWAENSDDNVGAVRLQTNKWSYDIQLLAGRYRNDWAFGVGWAGNIRTAGFKGEATVFTPAKNAKSTSIGASGAGRSSRTTTDDDKTTLSFTSTFEYGFRNGWSVIASYLLNTNGASDSGDFIRFFTSLPDAKNLMPNRHTALMGTYRQFSPVFMINLSAIYAFEVNWVILLPTISYSLRQNWDLDLIGQLFWGENVNGTFENQTNGIFARIRWSF